MSGLLGLLDLGAGAINAQNAGVAGAGRNVANVNTEGYARERIDLQSELGAPQVGGVRAGNLSRLDDRLLARREREAQGSFGQSDALTNALKGVEKDLVGHDLSGATAAFFASLSSLSQAPSDEARRAAVVDAARTLASAFRDDANAIVQARADSNGRIQSFGQQATDLAAQIARANQAIGTSHDPVLADQRDLAAKKLAELTGGEARIDSDGQMRVVTSSGAVLVDGGHAATIATPPDPKDATRLLVQVVDGTHVTDVTSSIGGRIGGEVSFRDGAGAQAVSDLDALAQAVAAQVNLVHVKYAGLDGVAGRNLFVPVAGPGAAAAMAVNPLIDADPRKLGIATPGNGPGDNAGALALTALRDQPLAGGNLRSFSDEAIHFAFAIGAAGSGASAQHAVDASRVDALASARDAISGVSTSEEMASLASFQHASEAAQQFVSVVNNLLDSMIRNL